MTRSKKPSNTPQDTPDAVKTDKAWVDPMREREAGLYERPIVSRELILSYLGELGQPAPMAQIAADLQVDPEDDESLSRRLRAMERDGQLVRNRKDAYGVAERMEMIRGRISGHPDGFGFLIPAEGGDDLFISPKQMRKVLHGDTALGRVIGRDRRGRLEGAIVRVLERARTQLVGRYFLDQGVSVVVPEDKRITHDFLVSPTQRGSALHGQIVTLEVTQWPDGRLQPMGAVIEVLGEHMSPGMEVEIAIRKHGLPYEWPAAVQAETDLIPSEVPVDSTRGRVDLRDLPLVTIDGEDARDFDDAVYAERNSKGFRLVVAIADVSTYVQPGSALDHEAYARGNSVYFPNRVIPMLPEALSNGLCSLNPHVDRLALVCDMQVSSSGNIQEFRFYEAVFRSQQRFTYNDVAGILQYRDEALLTKHAALLPPLEALYALYHAFLGARQKRGAIDFDTQETRIIYGADKRIERIVPTQRNDAHRLIEECMLAANVCAATFLELRKHPSLYRVHQTPPPDKLTDLQDFLRELDITFKVQGDVQAKHFAKLLEHIRQRKDFNLLQTVILRSMSQATYSPANEGHFGLAYEAYTHYTSPIRRYPDLLVHRAIKRVLQQAAPQFSPEQLQEVGGHCSDTERRADEATRDAVNWLKCEFMLDKVGQEFSGIITGVTSFGFFVQLEEIYVEGLVHISNLGGDYYKFQPDRYRLVGERTHRQFQLGDTVRVKVVQVTLDEGKIDFELADKA